MVETAGYVGIVIIVMVMMMMMMMKWKNDTMTIWCRNMWRAKCLRLLVNDIDHNVLCHIFRLSPVRSIGIHFEDVGVSVHLEDEEFGAKDQSSGILQKDTLPETNIAPKNDGFR